jgi:hypothetical protein
MTALLRVSECIQQRTDTLRPSFTSPPKCLTTSAMETEFASELVFDLFVRTTLDQSCAGIRSLLRTFRETLWPYQSYRLCCDDQPTHTYCKSSDSRSSSFSSTSVGSSGSCTSCSSPVQILLVVIKPSGIGITYSCLLTIGLGLG